MNRLYNKILFLGTLLFVNAVATAQTVELKVMQMADVSRIYSVSANGKWAVGCGISEIDKDMNPHLWNLTTYEDQLLVEDPMIVSGAWDVSDNGVVVGNYDDMPAYYKDGQWTALPTPEGKRGEAISGNVTGVSDDGRTMVGQTFVGARSQACMWIDGVLQETALPERDLSGDIASMNKFMAVSGDGSIAVGALSYNIFPGCSSFVYRNNECRVFGVDFTNESDDFGHIGNSVNESTISPNGKYIGGICHYATKTGPGMYDVEENDGPFFYNMEEDKLTVPKIAETGIFTIDNDGIYYGVNPINSLIREAQVYVNNEFVSFESVLSQYYNFNFKEESGYEQTGSLMSVSADGTVIVGYATKYGENWIIKLSKSIYETVSLASINMEKNEETLKITANGRELSVYGNAAQVVIAELSGKEVKRVNSPSSTISAAELGAGIYIVTLNGADGSRSVSKVCIK